MGRWAVLSFLLRVPWARLPRPAPLFPRSRFGQSPGGGDAGVPQRARRSGPAVSPFPVPAPSSTPAPALPPPLPRLRGGSAWRARSAQPGPRPDPGGAPRGSGERGGHGPQQAGGGWRVPASRRAPAFGRLGAPTRCAAAAGGRRAQLGAFPAAGGCARVRAAVTVHALGGRLRQPAAGEEEEGAWVRMEAADAAVAGAQAGTAAATDC